ncbi:hypothetical protein HBI25_159680 [Parastagonospora nodorum]|nr:hypothetical protein HBI09_195190 [Parastagonospora nodorum]KAH4161269.1 hypothetical protein HBH43_169990 [Parastagonospora nodorum]KAH4183648.1 hypothetical protein HBH42_202490 [Parastagonospora nodorum]KAH4202935.1 hypothetical protein HBI95_160080 [Parastagonospora nodorum]KAH4598953.1 hypothetical protein HBH82_210010 [Parastagonospora nodorum]
MHYLSASTAAIVCFLGLVVHGASLSDNAATTLSRFLHDGPPPSARSNVPSTSVNANWASTESARNSKIAPPQATSMTCWSNECMAIVYSFNAAYVAGGKLVEPSPGDGSKERFQSTIFQKELCVNRKYSDIKFEELSASSQGLDACLFCLANGGLEVKDPQSPAMTFKWKVWNVCHTKWPNEYEVLNLLTLFMRAGRAPDSFSGGRLEMTDIPGKVGDKFTWTSGMNDPTIMPSSATPMLSTTLTPSSTPSPTPSPTPSSTPPSTLSSTTRTSVKRTGTPSPPDPTPTLAACWVSESCAQFVTDIASAYKFSGDMKDPNQRGQNGTSDQSHVFQSHFCEDSGYKDIIFEGLAGPDTPMYACLQCFENVGIDTETPNTPAQNFIWKVHDFCHTDHPSLYDLLDHLLSFMAGFDAPTLFTNMPVQITALVPSLRDEFTWIDGMNRATDGPASPWWQTVLSSDGPIPTEYLSQVPRDWPYTEYGVKRKIGLVASWPFVHPNATSVTVAWLLYQVLDNPRPVYTPGEVRSKLNGSVWNPGLKDWRHKFMYDTVTVTASPAAAATSNGPQATAAPVRIPVSRTMIPASTRGMSHGGLSGSLPSMEMVTSLVSEETMGTEAVMKKFEELVGELEGIVKEGKERTTEG